MKQWKTDDWLRDALRAEEEPAEELNDKIFRQLKDTEKKKKMRSVPRGLVAVAGISLVIFLLGGTVFQDDVKAMMEKLFGPITESYVWGGTEQKKQVEEEVCKVGETVTRQGLSVTLEEVLVDANKVAYCIKVHSDERWGLPLTYAHVVSQVYVNGQKIQDTPSCVNWTADDHTQVTVGEVAMNPDMELKGDVRLEIRVTDVCTTPVVSGQWNFVTTANVDKSNSHTKRDLTTTVMKLLTGDILTIHKVVCTSTDCNVYMTLATKKSKKEDIHLHLSGTDNTGEAIMDSDCMVKKKKEKEKGMNEYDVVARFSGGFSKKVKKLKLAPYWVDFKKHKYKKVGEEFSVVLKKALPSG